MLHCVDKNHPKLRTKEDGISFVVKIVSLGNTPLLDQLLTKDFKIQIPRFTC